MASKLLKTKNYANSAQLIRDIELKLLADGGQMLTKLSSEVYVKMNAIIKKWYGDYTPSTSSYGYKRTNQFRDSLTTSFPKFNGNKVSQLIFFDESKIIISDGTATDGDKPFGEFWGKHNEYSDINSYFMVMDEFGWSFPKKNAPNGRYFRKPAESVDIVMGKLKSGKFDASIKKSMNFHGWKNKNVRR